MLSFYFEKVCIKIFWVSQARRTLLLASQDPSSSGYSEG